MSARNSGASLGAAYMLQPKWQNPTKARKATLTTIIAIAATSGPPIEAAFESLNGAYRRA